MGVVTRKGSIYRGMNTGGGGYLSGFVGVVTRKGSIYTGKYTGGGPRGYLSGFVGVVTRKGSIFCSSVIHPLIQLVNIP